MSFYIPLTGGNTCQNLLVAQNVALPHECWPDDTTINGRAGKVEKCSSARCGRFEGAEAVPLQCPPLKRTPNVLLVPGGGQQGDSGPGKGLARTLVRSFLSVAQCGQSQGNFWRSNWSALGQHQAWTTCFVEYPAGQYAITLAKYAPKMSVRSVIEFMRLTKQSPTMPAQMLTENCFRRLDWIVRHSKYSCYGKLKLRCLWRPLRQWRLYAAEEEVCTTMSKKHWQISWHGRKSSGFRASTLCRYHGYRYFREVPAIFSCAPYVQLLVSNERWYGDSVAHLSTRTSTCNSDSTAVCLRRANSPGLPEATMNAVSGLGYVSVYILTAAVTLHLRILGMCSCPS
jgi:hypothetical protein